MHHKMQSTTMKCSKEKSALKKWKKQFEEDNDTNLYNSRDENEKILMIEGFLPIDFDEYVKSGINLNFDDIKIMGCSFFLKSLTFF